MTTDFIKPANMDRQYDVDFAIGEVTPLYLALDADLDTMVNLKKNGETVNIEGTYDVNNAAGAALVDLEDAQNWVSLGNDGADFIKGPPSRGFTGLRITPADVPGTAAITGTVTQLKAQKITTKN